MTTPDLDAALLELSDAQLSAALLRRAQGQTERRRAQAAARQKAYEARKKADVRLTLPLTVGDRQNTLVTDAKANVSLTSVPSPLPPMVPSSSPQTPLTSPPLTPHTSEFSAPAAAGRGKSRKAKPAQPEKAPSDPRHQPCVDIFFAAFRDRYDQEYRFEGRDFKALQGFLSWHKSLTIEEFEGTLRKALKLSAESYLPACKDSKKLYGFIGAWNSLPGEFENHANRFNGRPSHLAARVSQEFAEPELKPTVFRP